MQTRSWLGYGCCSRVTMRSLANALVRFSPKKGDPRLEPTNSACPEVNQRPSRYPEIGAYASAKVSAVFAAAIAIALLCLAVPDFGRNLQSAAYATDSL